MSASASGQGAVPPAEESVFATAHSSRRTLLALASLLAAVCVLLLTAAPAFAFPAPRTFASQITGFHDPRGLAFDSSDNFWIGDQQGESERFVHEFGPYPSLTEVAKQPFEVSAESIALDSVNGDLYAAESNCLRQKMYVFENGTGPLLESIDFGSIGCGEGRLYVATDNSSPSTGRIYISRTRSSEDFVRALEPNGAPHDFEFSPPGSPGEYDYVSGNELTGTPSGPFAEPLDIATDSRGNIYDADRGRHVVDEFKPSGEFVREFTGAGAPGGFGGEVSAIAVDPTTGNVLIVDRAAGVIDEFEPSGGFLNQITGTSASAPFGQTRGNAIAINSSGDLYFNPGGEGASIDIFTPNPAYPNLSYRPISGLSRNSAILNAGVGPNGGGAITGCKFEYGTDTSYGKSEPCLDPADHEVGDAGNPIESEPPTEVHVDLSGQLRGNTTYHYRLVLEDSSGTLDVADREFETPPAVVGVKTDPATEVTSKSALPHGSFTGDGNDTTYHFEYTTEGDFNAHGYETATKVPAPDADAGAGTGEVVVAPVEATGLLPNIAYVYRLVAENEFGSTFGQNQSFTTFQAPTIEAFSSSNVAATSADLDARLNPQGFATKYHFEYGTTTAYGQSTPPIEITAELSAAHSVEAHLENLQQGATYHFRFFAESKWGTVTSEDQTFEFFPPACPNSAVRQQTGSAYLPDCRAYELVSPGNANGTLLFSGGPNPGTATSPSRFSYVGAYSALPGENVIGTAGDLYVATRTGTGWISHYVGLPGDQAACVGGPPTNPINHGVAGAKIQNSVLTDPAMDRFLDWELGTGLNCAIGNSAVGDLNDFADPPSDAPYLWSAEGSLLAHLPTNLSTPGAAAALTCPTVESDGSVNDTVGDHGQIPECTGEVTASPDLNHIIFSSRSLSFAEAPEAGLTVAPGSAYDDDLATGKITIISRLGTGNIPQDPSFAVVPRFAPLGEAAPYEPGGPEEFLRFPAVSTDGSHVLISTATTRTRSCEEPFMRVCARYTDHPIHLYMSIDDAATKPISVNQLTGEDVGVRYVGMTPDGSKVFFTSDERLTADDHDTSTDLYMWSEKGELEGHSLTLLSKGDNEGKQGEPGSTDACHPTIARFKETAGGEEKEAPWTTKCGVLPYSGYSQSTVVGGLGGNGISDSAIAENGDIYFFSPEQLDGDRGVLNQQNLYDYRAGRAQYVTTFAPGSACRSFIYISGARFDCAEGPILRFEVTPDDSRMAILTPDRLTSYDNAGHLEMYSYTPTTGTLVCDSCNPDGKPATADVEASQDGLFLTNDGRPFFSTSESLVPSDTNEGVDVYEYVDGRPQLITPGTGTATLTGHTYVSANQVPGLVGVSANGTDAYFSTFDTLLPGEDHNGNFLKFYDARTNGGFPQPPPIPPCEAAEECHGPGTEAPGLPAQGTAATLTGGNAEHESHPKHHKKHKKDKHHKKSTVKHHHKRADHQGRVSR